MPNTIPTVTHIYQNHHLDSTRWNAYVPRPDDIIVSTSYKSGTTWTQGILRQLVFQNQTAPTLDDISPWLDRCRVPIEEVVDVLEKQTHRRFIKSHLAADGIPYFPQVKYLIVGRDARDVAMSLWNHYSHYTAAQYRTLNNNPALVGPPMPRAPKGIHEFIQNWFTRGWFDWETEGYPFWGNLHHTASWWDYRHLDNILFVHFADMLANLPLEIKRIADFLHIPVTDASLAQIVQNVSLEAMRADAVATGSGLIKSFKGGAKTFFFQGINGRWKDVFTRDELDLYQAAVARNLTPDAARWLEEGRAALV